MTVLLSHQSYQASSLPQGGQNLWHVTAQIGTNVDVLLGCCMSTGTSILGLQSDLDACCATINANISTLSTNVATDFNGTFTAIAAIPATNFMGTYTAIAGLQSDLDACCTTIITDINTLSTNVTNGFNGTNAAIATSETAINNNTNTNINTLSTNITTDFKGTFTAIAALSTLITTDFNGTFTAIAAINCSGGGGSCDLSGTYTAIAALSALTTQDFNNTMTVLTAQGLCMPITVTGATTISRSGYYCVANNITGLITILGSSVVLDLNNHIVSNIAVGSVAVQPEGVIIKNGYVEPSSGIGINIPNGASALQILDVAILMSGSTTIGVNVVLVTTGFIINNVNVLGLNDPGTGTGFFINHSRGEILNSTCQGCSIGFQTDFGCSSLTLNSCQATLCDTNGFTIAGTDIIVENCISSRNSNNGFSVESIVANDIVFKNCIATGNVLSGFLVNLDDAFCSFFDCFGLHNMTSGFDVSIAIEAGLIKNCVAQYNGDCGFNDNSSSLYQYVANSAEHNGTSPADGITDTNYCLSGVGTAITPPGPQPYYQFPPNITGTGFAPTYWNNITLQ